MTAKTINQLQIENTQLRTDNVTQGLELQAMANDIARLGEELRKANTKIQKIKAAYSMGTSEDLMDTVQKIIGDG